MTPPADEAHDLLDHAVRGRIARVLGDRPGLSVSDLMRRLRLESDAPPVANGALSYHLYRLERAGLITSRRSGRCRRLYNASSPWGDPTILSVLQRPGLGPVAEFLLQRDAASPSELRTALGPHKPLSRQAISYRLGLLLETGLVVAERLGRRRLYRPTPRLVNGVRALDRFRPSWQGGSNALLASTQASVAPVPS